MIISQPTWDDDIQYLFSSPYWMPAAARSGVAKEWKGCMNGYLIDLSDYNSIKTWSVTIYGHLSTRSMPLTTDERQFWPFDALETFRLWVNQGFRQNTADAFDRAVRIPTPHAPDKQPYFRPDLATMSVAEIDAFRARLDDTMRIGDPLPNSPWQQYAYIHTNWCLHYQEAFAFWHRGYLLYIETLLGCPIPYWDWMAADASKEGSSEAGLPQCFLDKTYVHPDSGETRPNPLRFAAAKDGQSKLCAIGNMTGPDCTYVQRNPLFYTSGADQRAERTKLFAMVEIFQQQVVDAQKFETFSVPQGSPGFPWANIPAFHPPQHDDLYPNRDKNFDGAFEQPHDNFHGWIGPDMADNSFTAFDPIFICYHANIDRMLEGWIRENPVAQYTAGVPLRPFTGPVAAAIDEQTSELWRYTTLGDLAQDSRHLGYDFGPPAAPQFKGRSPVAGADIAMEQDLNASAPVSAQGAPEAWVIFDDVRCTHDSYAIDVFLGGELGPAQADNNAYVGRFSRIGMGLVDDKDRCVRQGVSRALDAGRAAQALGLQPGADPALRFRVTHLHTKQELCPDECQGLPGFSPVFHWGDLRRAPVSPPKSVQCCH